MRLSALPGLKWAKIARVFRQAGRATRSEIGDPALFWFNHPLTPYAGLRSPWWRRSLRPMGSNTSSRKRRGISNSGPRLFPFLFPRLPILFVRRAKGPRGGRLTDRREDVVIKLSSRLMKNAR